MVRMNLRTDTGSDSVSVIDYRLIQSVLSQMNEHMSYEPILASKRTDFGSGYFGVVTDPIRK